MPYYQFESKSGSQTVITDDRSGSKLPKRDLGWYLLKEIEELNDFGIASGGPGYSEKIAAKIKEQGYVYYPLED